MANLLSHPFRLNLNGDFATRDETTDEYLAERLAIVLGTRPGERATVPLFGVDDPVYGRLMLPALEVQVELFEIPVQIVDVATEHISDKETRYIVQFERETGEEIG